MLGVAVVLDVVDALGVAARMAASSWALVMAMTRPWLLRPKLFSASRPLAVPVLMTAPLASGDSMVPTSAPC